jgi:hypothetical protein
MRNRVAVACLGTLLSSVLAAQSNSGAFTLKNTTDSAGQSKWIVRRFVFSGAKARLEVSTPATNAIVGRTYLIMNGVDSTLTSVMPSTQSVVVTRVPRSGDVAWVPKTALSEVRRTDSVDLGPSAKILGYDTRHYRAHLAATITITFPDRVCTRKVAGTHETWITTNPEPDAIVKSAARSMIVEIGAMGPDAWMERIDSMLKAPPTGMALRAVSTDSVIGAGGQVIEKKTTFEVTELSRAPVDSATFLVPPDYHIRDLRDISTLDIAGVGATIMQGLANRMSGCVFKTKPPSPNR